MEEVLLYFSLKYNGDFTKIYTALETNEKVNEALKKELLKELTCKYTTMISKDYPECLKLINYPPFVLFYDGDLSLINKNPVVFAGTLTPSPNIQNRTFELVKELKTKNQAIISTLQRGINLQVHNFAEDNEMSTIVALESNLSKEIKKLDVNYGLIISERYKAVVSNKGTILAYNRLLAGLGTVAIIPETEILSPDFALTELMTLQEKDVYCIYPSVGEQQGTELLINTGKAKAIKDVMDIEGKEVNEMQRQIDTKRKR